MAETALVVFTPSGKRGRFALGTPLLQAARSLGVDLDSVCGGRGLCGRCKITLAEGEFAKHGIRSKASHLSECNAVEERYGARKRLNGGLRLGCQAELLGDVVIDVPPESQVHKQVVRKRAEVRAIELDPVVRLHYVEVTPPDMQTPS
ncbi:MAG: 2Fe-2S iron-sulfur cluster-binding protein, partial [Geminicoccaceae bacterium]